MKLRKFLQSIEELKPTDDQLTANNIPVSVLDDWEIDVLKEEFEAYRGIFSQMAHCLDTINLYPGMEQLRKLDRDAPEPFIIWAIAHFMDFTTHIIIEQMKLFF